jgi:integrase
VMPRPRPPRLQREITRHGKAVWYVRANHGPRIRIKAEFGTPEFDAEYQAALAGEITSKRKAAPSNSTLAWLLARYRETTAWSELSPATRKARENIFVHVIESAGHEAYAKITAAIIEAGRERRKPHAARNFLDAMRGLFRWAKHAGHVKVDPTAGVSNPKTKTGDGFIAWTEEHMAAYEARWPLGTRQRVWLDVLAYTGLRRGDAVRIGRQHVRNGVATLKTEKSGFKTEVALPILPVLQQTLDVGPCGDLAFICGETGRPLTKESFGNMFKAACKAAGVPGSAHGIRKIVATRLADAGATESELMAVFGWTDAKMATHYTRTANRKRLASQAMNKLAESIPAPMTQVRDAAAKAK